MQIDWAPAHCDALRECIASGLSFAGAANAINARFGTVYSRNAALGRAKRMGLAALVRPAAQPWSPQESEQSRLHRNRERIAESKPTTPASEPDRVKLRCIQIVPRHLTLTDLEAGDCRYPYGGDADGEAITFCGHPQHEGLSYCIGHFHLTRGPGTASERAAIPFALWLVQAA
jgi:GcrA cell cycle regulator